MPATAVMISKNLALTAAHVVYQTNFNGVFHDITVSPGFYRGNTPFGTSTVTNIILPNGWIETNGSTDVATEHDSYNYDWAILILDDSIGNNSGWLPTLSYEGPLYVNLINSTASIIGYPHYVQGINTYNNYLEQYCSTGTISAAYSKLLTYSSIDTSGGQSGSPILNSQNQIVGIHGGKKITVNSENEITEIINRGVRIYPDMNTVIANTLEQYSQ